MVNVNVKFHATCVCSTVNTKILHCLVVVQYSGLCLIAVMIVNHFLQVKKKLSLSGPNPKNSNT